MYISVSYELISNDNEKKINSILSQYGLKKIFANLYESYDFPINKLGSIKKDLESQLDMDDKLIFFQYPLENSFKISYYFDKKWKRMSLST